MPKMQRFRLSVKGKFYRSVINDVIEGVKDDFAEEGYETNVLQELKKIWETKLTEASNIELDAKEQSGVPASQYAVLLSNQKATQRATNGSIASGGGGAVTLDATSNNPVLSIVSQAPNNSNTTGGIIKPQYVSVQNMQHRTLMVQQPDHQQQAQVRSSATVLSGPASAAAMALPNSVYHQSPQLASVQQAHIQPRIATSGPTVAFPQGGGYGHHRMATNHLYSDGQIRAPYPLRPLPYVQRPGQILIPAGASGQQFILQSATGNGVPIQQINSGATGETKTFLFSANQLKHQVDGAGDSSSEEDDDDDDMVAVSTDGRHGNSLRGGGAGSSGVRGGGILPDHLMSPPASLRPPHSTLTSLGGGDVEEDWADGDDDDDDTKVGAGKSAESGEEEEEEEAEEEPLNSEDDVSDEEADKLFETDNVVVCQYDKINRSRNRWRFHLKDGIMTIGGKDYVFQKATGDAEW